METIFRWLAGLLAGVLEKYASPDLQAKLDAYNAKASEAEAKEKEAEQAAIASEAAYQTSVNRRKELDRLIQASIAEENTSEQRLAESQQRVKQLEAENQKAKDDLDKLSDHDRVRVNL